MFLQTKGINLRNKNAKVISNHSNFVIIIDTLNINWSKVSFHWEDAEDGENVTELFTLESSYQDLLKLHHKLKLGATLLFCWVFLCAETFMLRMLATLLSSRWRLCNCPSRVSSHHHEHKEGKNVGVEEKVSSSPPFQNSK